MTKKLPWEGFSVDLGYCQICRPYGELQAEIHRLLDEEFPELQPTRYSVNLGHPSAKAFFTRRDELFKAARVPVIDYDADCCGYGARICLPCLRRLADELTQWQAEQVRS